MAVKYRTHPQVTLERAAGRFFLVAFGKAGGNLPYVREINETGAYYWRLFSSGYDMDSILNEAAEIYGESQDMLKKGLQCYINDLKEKGYLFEDRN